MYFKGIDLSGFPGLDAMKALKAQFDFCAYYLAGPSHHDKGWLGKREDLVEQGWGLVPIFVGQQVIGPGQHVVSGEQGAIDGTRCAEEMAAEGFPEGSKVFLDLENGQPIGAAERAYVIACLAAIGEGGYVGGCYCSHTLAQIVRLDNPHAPLWCFRVPTVARTHAVPPFPAPNPAMSGFSAAMLWQYRQNVELRGVPGLNDGLVVDLDAATVPDPSAP